MACRNSKKHNCLTGEESKPKLWFGVDSTAPANTLLQNNLNMFEWVQRNKIYPAFWGRNIFGEDALTKEEIAFLRSKVCPVAPCCGVDGEAVTTVQGIICGAKASMRVQELAIPKGTAAFLEIREEDKVTTDYLQGYAIAMLSEGYVPGFKANTDAQYDFDREFSRGMQVDKETFDKCLIWATAPILPEYERMTTTHMLHPDEWKPFAPSGVKRQDIVIWQYGNECHPICDDDDEQIVFNIDLLYDVKKMMEYMC